MIILAKKFSLQPILSYKQKLEELTQIELSQLKEALIIEKEVLNSLENSHRENSAKLRSYQGHTELDLDSIRQIIMFIENLQSKIILQKNVVADAEEKVEAKRKQLLKIMQDRKALEKLKEKFEEEAEEAIRQEELRSNDEIGTNLHLRIKTNHANIAEESAD